MNKKVLIFDFAGTFYSGENAFDKLPAFINSHKREFLPNLTDANYALLVKENPFWKDVYSGADIADAIYKFKDKYPSWNISIKNYLKWENQNLEPIDIDKNKIVDTTFITKLCNKYNVYLVSNSSPFHLKFYLKYIGLEPKIFKKIISNRFTKRDKTKKHYYKNIIVQENCLPQNAYVFGDSLKNDLIPAQKLGMQTFLVKDATRLKDIVKQALK